jgi:F0F1-type ATP synthase assembly protein I
MRNSIAHGQRNAVRIVFFQLGIAGLIGLGFCVRDGQSGLAAWYGGGVIAIGSALFAWRLYADGIASTQRVARAVYVAEVLKWIWVVFALYLALAVLRLEPWPLIVSVIAAQMAFLAAVGIFRES